MAQANTPLYIGTGRFVAALDAQSGEELWRTKLPHSGNGGPVTLLIKGAHVFIGCHGRAYCLDKHTGGVLWQNGLPKMGFHAVLLALEGADAGSCGSAASAAVQRQREKAAAAAASGAGSV